MRVMTAPSPFSAGSPVHGAEVLRGEANDPAEAPEVVEPLVRRRAEHAPLEDLDGVRHDLVVHLAVRARVALREAPDRLAGLVEVRVVDQVRPVLRHGAGRHAREDQVEAEAVELQVSQCGAHRHEADPRVRIDRNSRAEQVLRQGEGSALVAPFDHRHVESRPSQVGSAREPVHAGPDDDDVEVPLHRAPSAPPGGYSDP
jgi:hypothetical protein